MSALILDQNDEIYFYLMGSTCGRVSGDFKVPVFQEKNSYNPRNIHSQDKLQRVVKEIAPGHEVDEFKRLASFILDCPQEVFIDQNFESLEHQSNAKNNKLSKLYDYKKLHMDHLSSSTQTSLNAFYQRELELCYCSTVMYLICKHADIKERMLITRHVNDHHAYLLNFFANGQNSEIVVDDSIPIEAGRGKIKYTNLAHGRELWPFLVEKAWVKEIGNYQKARGLSPEDCFEEMTGIPAYSYSFKHSSYNQNKKTLTNAIRNNFWVVLIGHFTEAGLKSRQVFYVEQVDETGQMFELRSPFLDFNFHGHEQADGKVNMDLSQIMKHFQFYTIGYYMGQYYQPQSLYIESKRDEEVIIEMNIFRGEPINIRFIQFYKQYFDDSQKLLYEYSPVFMELYNQQRQMIEYSEGLPEIIEGTRSSNLFKDLFMTLPPGKYYLRLQVAWVNQKQLNKGNLVVYASPQTATLSLVGQDHKELSDAFMMQNLQSPSANFIKNGDQEINVRWLEKQHKYILGIENVGKEKANLKLMFKNSENIKINRHKLINQAVQVSVDREQMAILQVLPADPTKTFYLAPFDILKV